MPEALAALQTALAAALAALGQAPTPDQTRGVYQTIADGLPRELRQHIIDTGYGVAYGQWQATRQQLEQQIVALTTERDALVARAGQGDEGRQAVETQLAAARAELATLRDQQKQQTRDAARSVVVGEAVTALSALVRPIAVRALRPDIERLVTVGPDGKVVVNRPDGASVIVPRTGMTAGQELAEELAATVDPQDRVSSVPAGGAGPKDAPVLGGAPAPPSPDALAARRESYGSM